MSKLKYYLEQIIGDKKKSYNTFLLEGILGVNITPIIPESLADAIGWSVYFEENKGDRKYYNFEGEYLEAISYDFPDDEKGGIIIFSTDVNANSEKGKIKGFFKSKYKTLINRLKKNEKLTKVLSQKNFEKVAGYSIGSFFKGRYFDRETEKTYDEKSLSVEIIGIPIELLIAIAEAVAKEFDQKEVLIKDHASKKIMLVNSK